MPNTLKKRSSRTRDELSKRSKSILSSKYDQTFILGMHHIDGMDSEEDKEYIVYCGNNLKQKYDSKMHPCQAAFYDIEQETYPDLTHLTSQSRLILIGHGTYIANANMVGFAGREAEQVVESIFEDCELHEVKTLKFISCKLGSGDFLDQMKTAIETLETGPKIMPQIEGYSALIYVSISGEIDADCAEEGIQIAKPYKIKK